MGRQPGLTRRGLNRAIAQAPRLVESAEQQTGATQRVAHPGKIADMSPRGQPLKELVAFPEPVRCLARLAELRQCPSKGGDRDGQQEGGGSGLEEMLEP